MNWNDFNWKCNKKNSYIYSKKNLGKNGSISQSFGSLPTNEEMKANILSRTDEVGFMDDILEWLAQMAPRKIRTFLKSLCPSNVHGIITYDDLCEAVYKLGFRTSETIERRMVIGSANEWAQLYFEDFPR